jgi:hypothetical protein
MRLLINTVHMAMHHILKIYTQLNRHYTNDMEFLAIPPQFAYTGFLSSQICYARKRGRFLMQTLGCLN